MMALNLCGSCGSLFVSCHAYSRFLYNGTACVKHNERCVTHHSSCVRIRSDLRCLRRSTSNGEWFRHS